MAKGRAICTCNECGKKFEKERFCYNRSDADSWERWAIENYTLCPTCYGRSMRAQDIAKGLYAEVRIDTHSVFTGKPPICIVFGGDTLPHKDEIRALDARWTFDYPSEGALGDLLMFDRDLQYKKWVIRCEIEEFDHKLEQTKEIGASVDETMIKENLTIYLAMKVEADKRKEEKKAAIKKQIGEKPRWTKEILELWPDNTTWNGKFYGKKGKWSVYFSGQKIDLTDHQKEEMEATYEERKEWEKKYEKLEREL